MLDITLRKKQTIKLVNQISAHFKTFDTHTHTNTYTNILTITATVKLQPKDLQTICYLLIKP